MHLYAPSPALRGRQLAADAGLLAWLVVWVLVARTVHGAVLALAEPGRAVEDLGASVAGSMSSAAQAAEDVPVVGDELAAPFDALGAAGGSVGGAGQVAQDAVDTLATVLAVVLVLLPVGWLLLRYPDLSSAVSDALNRNAANLGKAKLDPPVLEQLRSPHRAAKRD